MLRNATYQEKFQLLNPLMPKIIEAIKKDLRQEHLQKDIQFVKKHFNGKNAQKLTAEELVPAYSQTISEGAEELAEFIANRWLLKNSEVYYLFEEHLKKISPNFNELEELESSLAEEIVNHSVKQFGATKTYIFSVLNSVVFPQATFHSLHERALQGEKDEEMNAQKREESETLENLKQNQVREIARLTDKYEKKLQGLQKKYVHDVESLKKQIANLQRKLDGKFSPV